MSLFHIHVDAEWVSSEFESHLSGQLGFQRTDFVALDGGEAEPKNHFTLKLSSAAAFRIAFSRVVEFASMAEAMEGYVEGEFIALDHDFSPRPFQEGAPPPFKLQLASLEPGCFRESEIHVALCPEQSDPRLIRNLTETGMATIYIPKPWGISLIFTAQGKRDLVRHLAHRLVEYLENVGGAARCSIKEERIAKWWVSRAGVKLPPVVHTLVEAPREAT